eukprot:scaffold26497_cov70-Phaeocystis_antarctica.AAC.2
MLMVSLALRTALPETIKVVAEGGGGAHLRPVGEEAREDAARYDGEGPAVLEGSVDDELRRLRRTGLQPEAHRPEAHRVAAWSRRAAASSAWVCSVSGQCVRSPRRGVAPPRKTRHAAARRPRRSPRRSGPAARARDGTPHGPARRPGRPGRPGSPGCRAACAGSGAARR